MSITIANKLEIQPGNVIRIPGCEPVTSFTSLALAANMDCNASIISLEDAVNAISAVTGEAPCIAKVLNPAGVPGTGKFLELPDGPPPVGNKCPTVCSTNDWYRILKDAATPISFDNIDGSIEEGCDGFNYSGKRLNTADDHYQNLDPFSETANFNKAPNPTVRPNTSPLGGVNS